ncbi:2OG-Fe(II) oxygenase [Gluconacetobacter aggeris]|uniref:2OG-Fe(II) oxygenase n=1 Tax=Gluconacetobacter aggeris TaxID=1286186 RepID=UPI0023DD9D91|nr:2OG-Fe(II) oxygenase [Gluconacetobacter aggeris]
MAHSRDIAGVWRARKACWHGKNPDGSWHVFRYGVDDHNCLHQGDGVLSAVNQRPRRGLRGDYRVTLRHGVSRIRSGSRHALGVIFHDAA